MDKKQAQEIIRNTFENPFNPDRFYNFIKNLLNQIQEDSFTYYGKFIPDSYKPFISKYTRIGKYSDGENRIDILTVYLSKHTSIDRARSSQRNFIAGYLQGKYGSSSEKDAALVAFVSPDEADWRFSLVKMDYKFEQTKSGKMKVKEDFTPARRWSFLVGANEKSHTAQSRLVGILANDQQNPTLEEIENAFDIETVTKEFFLKYRDLFIRTKEELDRVVKKDSTIKEDFEAKGVDTVNFAKKLLGQIVFLYFLQKKGWFGVKRGQPWGSGSKHFLRELFTKRHGDYKNFFNEILEPLFYEALRLERQDDYYSRFDCRIPFLNGGLFDPINDYDWIDTDILLPNDLFSNGQKTKEGDTGTGILDVFDRYNFTVKEDEPLEKEVAIDPELLGKAYEKFNAIRPDNFEEYKKSLKSSKKGDETKFNKQYGVYYTPRVIVHYMSQQSLINYLYTELNSGPVSYEKLGDPQLNMLGNKGEKGQLDLTIEHKSTPSISKEDIEALIHVGEHVSENEEIALIKEKSIKDGKQVSSVYKLKLPESIRQNASLIDRKLEEITVCDPAVGSGAFPVGMMSEIVRARNVLSIFLNDNSRTAYEFKRRCIEHSLYGVDIDPGAVEIAKLRLWLSLVVDEDDIKNIKPLPNLDYKVVCGNSLMGVEKNLLNEHLFIKLEELKSLYFNETNIKKKQNYKNEIDKLIHEITNGHEEFDFEVYFSEVFHNKGGFDIVIGNPPYLFLSGKGSPVQQLLKAGKQKEANELNALLEFYTRRFPMSSQGCKDYYKWFIDVAFRIVKPAGFVSYITPNTYIVLKKYSDIRKILFSDNFTDILLDIGFGIFDVPVVPSAIFVAQRDHKKQNNVLYCDLKEIERDILLQHSISSLVKMNSLEVSVRGSELLLYKHPIAEKIYLSSETTLHKYVIISEGEHNMVIDPNRFIEKSDDNAVPVIYDSQMVRLIPTKIVHIHKRDCPNFNRDLHSGDRFFIRKTGDKIVAAPPPNSDLAVAHQNVYVVHARNKDTDLRVLLGILNSSLLTFLYQNGIYGQKGRTLAQLRIYALYLLPIPDLRHRITKDIAEKVEEILRMKNGFDGTEVKLLEQKIDELVYKLYGLTDEEIGIIDNSGKQ